MPLVDMPLEELHTYQGRNPRPEDHDAYWDAALVEMRGVDPEVELVPASFQTPGAECFDLWFTGVGGARVYAKYARPRSIDGPIPAVVEFHGYTMHSGDWVDRLRWPASGLAVASLDVRGQGGKSQDLGCVSGTTHHGHIIRGLNDSPEKLFYRSAFLDTAQLANILMEFDEVDADRIGARGGSQGGALTLACAALEPRIKRAVAVYPFLSDYQRVWEMDLAGTRAYGELQTFFKHHDPAHAHIEEWWRRLGYIDIQHLAPRIKASVLMAVGLMDDVCPPSTQFAAYNKITSDKRLSVYPDFGHEHLPGFADEAYQFMLGL